MEGGLPFATAFCSPGNHIDFLSTLHENRDQEQRKEQDLQRVSRNVIELQCSESVGPPRDGEQARSGSKQQDDVISTLLEKIA